VDYHVVTLGNFRNTFYNHADFGRTALAETWTSSVFAKAVSMWIKSIDHVKLCIEYGENAHLKLKNGKTIDRWTFVLPNHRENKHKLSHEVVGTVNLMKKLYSDRKKNPPDELCLNYTTGWWRTNATTGHKLQGMSKDVMIVTSWPKGGLSALFKNWEYVVLSRVRTLEGLYLFEPIDLEKSFKPSLELKGYMRRATQKEKKMLELREIRMAAYATK
jgi:hypothetical protein